MGMDKATKAPPMGAGKATKAPPMAEDKATKAQAEAKAQAKAKVKATPQDPISSRPHQNPPLPRVNAHATPNAISNDGEKRN